MPQSPQVEVVLCQALWKILSCRSRELGVPLELLVAGLVCDTIQPQTVVDSGSPTCVRPRPGRPSPARRRTESHRPVRAARH
ncbi:hypothetical protein OJF2_28160 [Aquisphaera giovannonii]|uniref:Uncharacterized protein n=1 Tax=Aquisphaera giovannonii TaxID=406548 RepID=A0A5B9W2C7_9BACT|nr:hypothetical protein OJF2_28160 [Aquisphaera giovannonii]